MSRLITEHIRKIINSVLCQVYPEWAEEISYTVDPTRERKHGDFATNLAFTLSKKLRKSPHQIAEELVRELSKVFEEHTRLEVAGRGFINVFVEDNFFEPFLEEVLQEGNEYGKIGIGNGERVQVEFVSVNPTGPLHVGHGKCAAFGDSLAKVLKCAGYNVEKEYYINDAGTQIDMLGMSLEVRYRELLGMQAEIPSGGYYGDYLIDVARTLLTEKGDALLEIPEEERNALFRQYAVEKILSSIRKDLEDFRVTFDNWFSERTLYDNGEVEGALERLREQRHTFEKDGALWLETTRWGDDKDRVLVRENGSPTYFTSDIAYHWNKWKRGFKRVIDVWGADHHGYIPRMRASMHALGLPENFLDIYIVQFVTLLRKGQPERMSTRQGEFVPLRNLIDEVGTDVARYYFLMRDPATHLEFDIEEAKKHSMDNPVYYVQYAHARIASVFREARKKGLDPEAPAAVQCVFRGELEKELVKKTVYYPEIVRKSAQQGQPYMICNYLHDVAGAFHAFYNHHRILDESDPELTASRVRYCLATRTVLRNGLSLLGITAPQTM